MNGYIAGIVCLLIAAIFATVLLQSGIHDSGGGAVLVFTILFGGLGMGSLWKPESIGQITAQILDNFAKNTEQGRSSKNKTSNVKQTIHNYGSMTNTIGSENTVSAGYSTKKRPR